MTAKTRLLSLLPRRALLRVAHANGIEASRSGTAALERALLDDRQLQVDDVLDCLRAADLRPVCEYLGLPGSSSRGRMVECIADWCDALEAGAAANDDEEVALACGDDEPESADRYRSAAYAADFRPDCRASARSTQVRPYQREALEALRRCAGPRGRKLLHVATGGGKTVIANDFLAEWIDHHERAVLWVTKDWRLLKQAASDAARRHLRLPELRRIGGDGTVLHPLSTGLDGAAVVYTTLQTFARRHAARDLPLRPSLLVWDECHWGEHARSGRRLLKWADRLGIPVLGLTATPRRPAESVFEVAYSRDFASLVSEGWLARPHLLAPVETGVPWTPERAGAHADFRHDSLERLGRSAKRNARIVEHYVRNRGKYGRTIIFACSIEHAELLARRLSAPPYGIPARALHSAMHPADREAALRDFENGRIEVLVNVAMLTHGVDLPAVRTVFLCRPTLSDMLFSQMIGRATRLDPAGGKKSFNVVEFTDNLAKFGDQLVTATRYFQGTATGEAEPKVRSRGRPARGHGYDPTGTAIWIPDAGGIPEAMRGLWFRKGQTFGVEIELTRDDFSAAMDEATWRRVAEPLRETLVAKLGTARVAGDVLPEYGSSAKSHEVWNVERDGSCGWEVTTRVLRDEAGLRELIDGCEAIESAATALGLKVDYSTGMHVHLGWLGRSAREIRRAIQLARLFEPALATLVSPSRIARFHGTRYDTRRPNGYCEPVSSVFPAKALEAARTMEDIHHLCREHDARYVTFNVRPLQDIHTVEVRLHGGTTDARKILLWLSLWQQLLWAAQGTLPIENVPDRRVIVPDGDILALVRQYFPKVEQPRFIERLVLRREEIFSRWQRIPELGPWCASYAPLSARAA